MAYNDIISVVAGVTQGNYIYPGYNGDNIPATSAQFYGPYSVVVDGSGNLGIADSDNQRVREVNTSATLSTVTGNGTVGCSGMRLVVVLGGNGVGVMIVGGGFAVADVIVACSFAEGCMILRGGVAVAGVIVDYDVSARRPGGQAGK